MSIYFYNVNSFEYISLKDGLTFGRNKADVVFEEDGRMSGLHGKVHVKLNADNSAQILIEDLNSKNRTSVDNIEIEPYQPQKLTKNCIVEMGNQRFILTEANNLDILFVNSLIEKLEAKPQVKLEGKRLIQDIQNKVIQKVEELKGEHRVLQLAIEESDKKIRLEMDKIHQVDVMKQEFLRKQEEERKAYFLKLDEKVGTFNQEISKFNLEKSKLQEKANLLDEQIQLKATRVKKEGE